MKSSKKALKKSLKPFDKPFTTRSLTAKFNLYTFFLCNVDSFFRFLYWQNGFLFLSPPPCWITIQVLRRGAGSAENFAHPQIAIVHGNTRLCIEKRGAKLPFITKSGVESGYTVDRFFVALTNMEKRKGISTKYIFLKFSD